jgi:cysteinyl-tRNA synthetase
MDDDFDTPAAYAALFELRDEVRKTGDARLAGLLKALGGTIGLLQTEPASFIAGAHADDGVSSLIEARSAAKKDRDFARADAIRQALDAMGIVLEDKPGGVTEWRRK